MIKSCGEDLRGLTLSRNISLVKLTSSYESMSFAGTLGSSITFFGRDVFRSSDHNIDYLLKLQARASVE